MHADTSRWVMDIVGKELHVHVEMSPAINCTQVPPSRKNTSLQLDLQINGSFWQRVIECKHSFGNRTLLHFFITPVIRFLLKQMAEQFLQTKWMNLWCFHCLLLIIIFESYFRSGLCGSLNVSKRNEDLWCWHDIFQMQNFKKPNYKLEVTLC